MKHTPTRYWDDVLEGQELPSLNVETSLRQAIMHVGAGRDYMRDHYDVKHASAHGHPSVFFNTVFHQSMVDRTIFDWAGAHCFLARRKITMKGPIYAGDSITSKAIVDRVFSDENNRGRVDLSIQLVTPRGICCDGNASIVLPKRSSTTSA